MKKGFGLCLIAALLAVLVCLPVYAAEEEDVVVLHNMDTAIGSWTLNTEDPSEGTGCAAYRFTKDSTRFAIGASFPAKDATEADTLAIDIYVSRSDLISGIKQMILEITSSGKYDVEEYAWSLHEKGYTGVLKEGWNTVYLYIEEAILTAGGADLSRVNYFRIYANDINGAALDGEEIRFDNLRLCRTGGKDWGLITGLDYYQGDNSDTDIVIAGMTAPDLSRRDEGITIVAGLSRENANRTYAPAPNVGMSGAEESVSTSAQQESADSATWRIWLSVGIVTVALVVTGGAFVLSKKKHRNTER